MENWFGGDHIWKVYLRSTTENSFCKVLISVSEKQIIVECFYKNKKKEIVVRGYGP
jgi:hypothetical protein